MKYSGYYNCRECGKTWWHKSDWIPFELVDWWYSILFLFHIIFHHFDKVKIKHILKGLWDIVVRMGIAILCIIVTIIEIIFYPLKLLVDLLY